MPFAQGSRSYIQYIPEVTAGTTPATPQMVQIPINSHSLGLKKATMESNEIRSDRQVGNVRHGNKRIDGEIDVEFRGNDYDPFLESALFGAFTTGTLKLGTTQKFMTIEDGAVDINQYRVFTGCTVDKFTLDVKPNQIIGAKFGMVGYNMTTGTTPLDSTPTAMSTNQPFDSFSGTITEGGSAIAIVTGLTLNVDNSVQPTYVIGSAVTPQMEYGRGRVTGEITCYFQDMAMINKFVNETLSSLVFSLTGSGDTYTFTVPKIKYTGADVPLQSEQSRLITMPFVGLYDTTEATSLKIVKS